jgi:hypothetical protein
MERGDWNRTRHTLRKRSANRRAMIRLDQITGDEFVNVMKTRECDENDGQ